MSSTSRGIDDLPPELLRKIFEEYARNSLENERTNAPAASTLSHVSTHWRAVALAMQDLWGSALPRGNVQWTLICLSRCPTSLFDCTILGDSIVEHPEYRAALDLVLPQLSRVKTLKIGFTPYINEEYDDIYDILNIVSHYDLSWLQRADFSFMNLSYDGLTVAIPPNLLPAYTSSPLTSLLCKACTLTKDTPWSLIGSNIRDLHLHNTIAWDGTNTMVVFLQAFPLLEELELEFHIGRNPLYHSFSRTRHTRAVQLDHLKSLRLSHHWLDSLIIFICLAIPSEATIRLHSCEEAWDNLDAIPTDILSSYFAMGNDALHQHFAPAIAQGSAYQAANVSKYSEEDGEEDRFALEVDLESMSSWFSNGASPDSPIGLPAHLSIDVPHGVSFSVHAAAIRMLFTLPIFSQVVRITFNMDLYTAYPGAYGPQIDTLRVVGDGSATSVFHCFRYPTFVPKLKRLHAIGVKDRNAFQSLIYALGDVRAVRDSFEHLELSACDLHQDSVDGIRERLGIQRVTVSEVDQAM